MDTPSTINTFKFTAPSGHYYVIREQNGNDDDILSNYTDAENLMNITKFISAIVVETDFVGGNGRLTPEEAHKIPSLDRYCILFQSRIFSYGPELEFKEDWGEKLSTVEYTQDLTDFVFQDYGKEPTSEELKNKPDAIPYYPYGKLIEGLDITLESGKELKMDVLTGEGEAFIVNLPPQKQTKNASLMARNLRLKVDGKFEKVTNFSMFTPKDMMEIRSFVRDYDPIFEGVTEITHPSTGATRTKYIMGIDSFFYPWEI